MQILYFFVKGFSIFILCYAVLIIIIDIVQLFSAIIISYRIKRIQRSTIPDVWTDTVERVPISIIVPARNESTVILESLSNFLSLSYPVFEVVMINDDSSDDTLAKVVKAYDLKWSIPPIDLQVPCAEIRGIYRNEKHPKLVVVDKKSGGAKADASNAGINVSKYPYFLGVDADCMLDEDSLMIISRNFMMNSNVKAVGGMIRLTNGRQVKNKRIVMENELSKKHLVRFQTLEYYRSFLVGRMLWSDLNALTLISGAFGVFEKKTVIAVGGYSLNSAGEDMELIVKIHHHMRRTRQKYEIRFSPQSLCWTQVPETLRDFTRQRRRWAVGLIQVIHRYKGMLFNPRYGLVGTIVMPYHLLYEYLNPIITVVGILLTPLTVSLDIISLKQVGILFVVASLLGVIMSIGSVIVNEKISPVEKNLRDYLVLIQYSFIDVFFFRPLTFMIRLQATIGYNRYVHVWDSITRQSFVSDEDDKQTEEDTELD